MNHRLKTAEDPKIAEMLDVIFKFAAGDLKARGTVSDDDTSLDAVMVGINILGEELEAYVAENQQAEDALRESEKRHQAVIASALDAIIVNDDHGRIVEFNPAAERMFGYRREEALGREIVDLIVPNSDGGARRQAFSEELARGIPAFQGRRVEVPALHADGHEFPAELAVVRIEHGGRVLFAGFARDLTERKQAERALLESEGLLRITFDAIQDGILVADAKTRRYLMANASMCRMLGYSLDDLLNLKVEDLHPADALSRVLSEFGRIAEGEIGMVPNLPVKRKDGTIFYADINSSSRMFRGAAALVGVFRDITARRLQEQALRDSEERFKSILENVVEMFFIADGSLHAEYVSPRCLEIYGYSAAEMIARPRLWMEAIHPEDRGALAKRIAEELRGGARAVSEYRIIRKDGSVRWIRSVSNPVLGTDAKLQRVYGTVMDITEFESLRSSLSEKEVLLKEIHHRVKNNLQIVISLMRLESRAFSEERVRAALKDLETRIRAMALVHEHLYHSSDLSKIGFKDYLKGLCEELFRTYRADGGRIALEIDAEAVALDIERAIPCGLIINELLTNAIKYAYPGRRKGVLRVAIRNTSDHQVEIVVSDDGIGLPDTLDIRQSQTLGLQLVTTLVENQLKGRIELERAEGTRFRIRFGI